jgi:nitrate/TMAO reductase-like tetraheme cytochrome c subunit
MRARLVLMLLVLVAGACKRGAEENGHDAGTGRALLSRAELMDPRTCEGCHPVHYREWSGSMHAYASKDPVFVAMNARGQRETKGELGEFCVRCHAPMALREGLTQDGTNLAELPEAVQGVTCYFCHNAVAVGPDHVNAPIELADDTTMRADLANAVDPGVHGVARSELHDRFSMQSSILCGSCHDVRTPKGVHIERTLEEYKQSASSIERFGKRGGASCQGCHMQSAAEDQPAASMPGVSLPARELHAHRWAAVDVALTDFPEREAHRHATECELLYDGAQIFEVFNDGAGRFDVSIETTAGHAQPSGAAQDRRMWLEFVAYDAADKLMFQSGVIAEREQEEWPIGDPRHDPQLWMFRDRLSDAEGREVHMFWEAERYDSALLPAATDPGTRHVLTHTYVMPLLEQPARVEMRLKIRPIGIDVLQSLVESKDLDPAVIDEMPTFTLHKTHVVWRPEGGQRLRRPEPEPEPIDCY